MRILVTGGVRSGKSQHAEGLFGADDPVVYVAPGPVPRTDSAGSTDPADADWAARIAAHRATRPAHWSTVEGTDLVAALEAAPGPVLVDCLGTWLTALIDAHGWETEIRALHDVVRAEASRVAAAVRAHRAPVVLVTNEVGWGVVPAHRSGRLFADLLGTANQLVAQGCDEVHLVVAGRVLRL